MRDKATLTSSRDAASSTGDPHGPRRPAVSRRRALLLWGIALVAMAAAVRLDPRLTQFARERLDWLPKHVLVSFRDFGQITPVIAVTIALAVYDRRRKLLVPTMIAATAWAGLAQGAGKLAVVRYRPNTPEVGALSPDAWTGSWSGVRWGRRPSGEQSFPSGHTCLAFAFAGVLAGFYPRVGWLFWALAAGCGLSRYVEQMHWLSDCIAGGILGYATAWLCLLPIRRALAAQESHEAGHETHG